MLLFRRSVNESDVAIVKTIVESTGFFLPSEVDVAIELVKENLEKGALKSGYNFLFAEQDGNTVGYSCFGPIACTKGSFDLFWIAVNSGARGNGFGSAILKESEITMQSMGCTCVYIETSSKQQYEPTRTFYLKNGYAEAAFLDHFYDTNDGKLIYRKFLPALGSE